MKSAVSRVLNAILWFTFCLLAGSGLLLAWRLPPGSRGGAGLVAAGWSRHDWGDFHTWTSYGFLLLVAIHLALHWRWFWQVAAKKRPWPLLVGIGAGLALMAWITLQPVSKRSEHAGSGHHESHH